MSWYTVYYCIDQRKQTVRIEITPANVKKYYFSYFALKSYTLRGFKISETFQSIRIFYLINPMYIANFIPNDIGMYVAQTKNSYF